MEYAERCDWEDGIHQDDPTILETLSEIAINDDPDDEDLDAIELDDDEYFDLEADVHDDFDPYELEDRLMDEHGVPAEGYIRRHQRTGCRRGRYTIDHQSDFRRDAYERRCPAGTD